LRHFAGNPFIAGSFQQCPSGLVQVTKIIGSARQIQISLIELHVACGKQTTLRMKGLLFADVFIPKRRIIANEIRHHVDTLP